MLKVFLPVAAWNFLHPSDCKNPPSGEFCWINISDLSEFKFILIKLTVTARNFLIPPIATETFANRCVASVLKFLPRLLASRNFSERSEILPVRKRGSAVSFYPLSLTAKKVD